MDDDRKREVLDTLAEAIDLLLTLDDAKRQKAVKALQYIYNCVSSDLRGEKCSV
jgi:hypothetical protein